MTRLVSAAVANSCVERFGKDPPNRYPRSVAPSPDVTLRLTTRYPLALPLVSKQRICPVNVPLMVWAANGADTYCRNNRTSSPEAPPVWISCVSKDSLSFDVTSWRRTAPVVPFHDANGGLTLGADVDGR